MLASSGSATNFTHNERKTIGAFLLIFISMVVLILLLVSYFYYQSEKNLMLSQYRLELQLQSESFIPRLRKRHINFDKNTTYPKTNTFNSAIYDYDNIPIFSTLHTQTVNLHKVIALNKGYIQFVTQPESYYLGAKYIVLELKDDEAWKKQALQRIYFYGTLAIILFTIIGVILAKLLLRPMKSAVKLLDNFIKDTTHELNTPIAAILTNIETISPHNLDDKTAKKINRIAIAARTISTIYDDLSYLTLNHNLIVNDATIDLQALVEERLEYFSLAIKQKKLRLTTHLHPSTLYIDRTKCIRVVDNLLSNAIKYNKVQGDLTVSLSSNTLCIKDTGKGIAPDKLQTIFKRYVRADTVVGGFGLGLHIVSIITKHYNIHIDIQSTLLKGTTITLNWGNND